MASERTEDPAVLTQLDTAAAYRWAVVTRAALASRRAEIDALNVFPVPDGDTGTNLYLTYDAALDAVRVEHEERPRGREAVPEEGVLAWEADRFARALLLTARGNSGVILSQIFRGFADEVASTAADALDGPGLARALARADTLAWASVTRPVEGTILSVSRAAAAAAAAVGLGGDGGSLYAVCAAALKAARAALAATRSQLPALARAGVVDAGGAGYVLLLEALDRVVGGDVASEALVGEHALRRREGWAHPAAHHAVTDAALGPLGPAYEVMFLLSESTPDAVARLRGRLDALGDSVLVVGSGGLHNAHAHVDDVGAAIEAGLEAGRPHRIRVTHLGEARRPPERAGTTAVVACAPGEGLAGVFRAAGAQVVLTGPRHRASAGQLLAAARSTGVGSVLLLPNDADTMLAAQAAARAGSEEGLDIRVVPARTAVQGIAALAVHEPGREVADDVVAMTSAAAATRNGAVAVATKDALTSAGWCHPGDVLGIVDGEVVVVGDDLHDVSGAVVDRLLASGGELLTLVSGADAPPNLGEDVAASARIRRRDLEVAQLYGGQPVYPLLLGVE